MNKNKRKDGRGRNTVDDPKVVLWVTIPSSIAHKWGCGTYRNGDKNNARIDSSSKVAMTNAVVKFLTENQPES